MVNIIIVFPRPEDGKAIRNLLKKHGYDVTAVCTLGSQVFDHADMMRDGIVICGYRFADMDYLELKASLPPDMDMLLLASPRVCAECEGHEIICVSMPLKVQDLINTLEMMCMHQLQRRRKRKMKPKKRSEGELKTLQDAKRVLMERNHMTEEEAHRYIQKCSMDSGTSLVETAQMVLSLSKI